MKKLTIIFCSILLFTSCVQKKSDVFIINGEVLQDSLKTEEIILLTQVDELADTLIIQNNKFTIKGTISEPTNAALVIDGIMLKFPLVNDQIDFKINDLEKKLFEVKYKNSKIQENLNSYFNLESKNYVNKFKEFISLEIQSNSDSIKMKVQSQKDSLSLNLIENLIDKYSVVENREGLTIIVSDLKGLFGTKNKPEKIEELFNLISIERQNGFYGKKTKTYLDQSYKIALGEKVDFKFSDINNKEQYISENKGKLILLEFWATWCGPCISQLPSLRKINQSEKIKIISISIDNDIDKWKSKVSELDMDWTNIHYKQDENLKNRFFVNGVPYNILLSQEGEILRKNIQMSELIRLLE